MSGRFVPFDRLPGIAPLYLDFLRGLPDFYPDPPSLIAARKRGAELLGRRCRVPADAFEHRHPRSAELAEKLAAGRAVAVVAGHQIGLFTGPLFTVLKAFDAIRVARQLSEEGVPAVPVFFALTDDHDLEEIAKTARPGDAGPEVLVLEGADRSNRRPVGPLPIPEGISRIVDAFRPDASAPDAGQILDAFARRYAPGTSYRDAFAETLFDLVDSDPLLLLDPLSGAMRAATRELYAEAVEKERDVRERLRTVERRLAAAGKSIPVQYRDGAFPFFIIEGGERRRIEDPRAALGRLSSDSATISADVLTRPILKSSAMPVAATVLGPAEVAYHAEALALFDLFDLRPPVLLPRSHVIPVGPKERRACEALGITPEDVVSGRRAGGAPEPAAAEEIARLTASLEDALAKLEPSVRELDPTLVGALETARRKIAYQLEQLNERMKKAAERKDEVASGRRRRLETMLLPLGTTADRVYPPLVPLLAYGRPALDAIRDAAGGSTEGAVLVDLPREPEAGRDSHAG